MLKQVWFICPKFTFDALGQLSVINDNAEFDISVFGAQLKFALVMARKWWSMDTNFAWFRTGFPSNFLVWSTTPGASHAATSSELGPRPPVLASASI